MRLLIITLVFFSCILYASQKPTVQIYHSEAASYLHFLAAGFDKPSISRSVKKKIKEAKIKAFEKKRKYEKV